MQAQVPQAQVLRMENAQGHGPFTEEAVNSDYDTAADMWRNVPWIKVYPDGLQSTDETHTHHLWDVLHMSNDEVGYYDENKLNPIAGKWTVGTKDLRQFEHWFPRKSWPDFGRHGMQLDVYSVPKTAVRYGKYQVMFDPTKAHLVKALPLAKGGKA